MKRIINFIRECRAELGKVEWPSKDEVVGSTVVVLVSVSVISLGLGAMDFVLTFLVKFVMGG